MKKLFLLVVAFALFAVSCSASSTSSVATDRSVDAATSVESDDQPDAMDDEPASDSQAVEPTAEPAEAPEPTQAPEPTVAPEPTQAPEPTPVPEPTAAAEPQASGDTASSGDMADIVSAVREADDWCAAAQLIEDSSLIQTPDVFDPEQVEQSVVATVQVFTEVQDLVPAEIEADVQLGVEMFIGFGEALEEVEWNFLDVEFAPIFGPEMELAEYNIDRYNYDNCSIGFDPGERPTLEQLEAESPAIEDGDTLAETVVNDLVAEGFTEEEATCILDSLDLSNPDALSDPFEALALFEGCNISLERLLELDGE